MSIYLSSKNLGSADIALLTAWLQRLEVSAAVNSLTVDSTGDTQDRRGNWNNGGPKTYTLTAGDVSIDLSAKNLGPKDVALLTAWMQRPEVSAAVKMINLSGCTLTGATMNDYGEWENIDSDMTGFIALCGVLGKLHDINLSDCHLGPASAGEFAKAVSSADAAINSLAVKGCPIGYPSSVSIKDGAETGVDVKQGAFAAVDGRWGEVTQDPDSGNDVKLRWLDDGTESNYTKANKLNPVVTSRVDLVENYSHIEKLGQAVTRITELDLADCGFNPVSIATLTRSVRWADAALAVLNIACAFTPFTSSLLSPVHPIDQLTLITGIYYYSPYL
eukprot:COSAG05_NODE_3140_length_2291_cov_23.235401_1_plen_331_part_10